MAMTLVETVTLTSTSNLVSFSNVPQTGTDLLILVSHRQQGSINTGNVDSVRIELNGVSASTLRLLGNGTTVSSSSQNTGSLTKFLSPNHNSTANIFANTSIYISNYRSATTKVYSLDSVTENNGTTAYQEVSAGQVLTDPAVTSVAFRPQTNASGTFTAGCTFSLYIIS